MMFIVIGNLVVFLIEMMDTTGTLEAMLVFSPALFCRGQVWRIVTFLLVPNNSNILWLAISLYFYYFIGSMLEREWGAGKFTIYYFSAALISVIYALVVYWIFKIDIGLAGMPMSYYMNMSLFFAFATLWPNQQVLLFFIIPLRMKWLALFDAGYFIVTIIRYVIAAVQLGEPGYITFAVYILCVTIPYFLFCADWLFDLFTPRARQARARTINLKKAVRRAEAKKTAEDTTRRCAVCGRTAEDNPGLEFRYCSRCVGYHCFCIDHINSHIHFTE